MSVLKKKSAKSLLMAYFNLDIQTVNKILWVTH